LFAAALAAGLLPAGAQAQGTVKIGVISAYSGQFADTAAQIDNGIKLYMKQHGDSVAGKKIEIIRKDTGGPNPDVAKRLAQELVVRDGVDILAGFTLKIDGRHERRDLDRHGEVRLHRARFVDAAADRRNAGHLGRQEGRRQEGLYDGDRLRPRHRRRRRVPARLQGGGRRDHRFGAHADRQSRLLGLRATRQDLNPESIFVFVPGGAQPAALGKAFAERGMDPNKIKIMSTGEAVDETAIKSMGDIAIGRLSAWHYDYNHKSKMNEDFVKAFNAEFKRNPDFFAVGGYDGMHLIYEALKKTGGKTDGDSLVAAAKGMKWESPRGPISIDAATRDIVQTVYIRRVEKVGSAIVNVEFDKVENVKDPTHK
jgi:branched-chain amino acid transport system substrate-binding protein